MSERPKTRKRAVAVGASLMVHGAMLAALIWGHGQPPQTPEAPLMTVSVVEGISVAPAVTPPTPQPVQPTPVVKASAAKPNTVRRTLPRPSAEPLEADDSKTPGAGAELTEAELAGAATAGSGAPGGTCDMARLLQTKLRRDPLVQAAVAGSGGKAIRVWNGDWVQSHGEDGKGLAAVRESMIWEIAFAPEGCRGRPVHGLVLLTLNDGPGAARLAVGSGEWRWSDLLGNHR